MYKKIFVVIDYQNDFVDGSLGFPGAENLDSQIFAKLQECANDEGCLIVVTRDTHGEQYLNTREGKALPIIHCLNGTHGWQVYGKTGEFINQLLENGHKTLAIINKATFGVDPFSLTCDELGDFELDNIESVEFCGLVTNMCVVSNVCCFQARFPNAQMIVHSNMVNSFDPELHSKTLDVLRGMQVSVL